MRRSWVTLMLAGLVPTCSFYVLDSLGGTNALHFISTTAWQHGSPSLLDIILMFASVFSWMWVKGFMNLFLFAAVPFMIGDVLTTIRGNSIEDPCEADQAEWI